MPNILEIHQVKKKFKQQEVLKGIDLTIEPGKIVGFIGKNGAGKTTLMKSIVGLLPIDSGQIFVDGHAVIFGQALLQDVIGYLPDVPEFYGDMTAKEYLYLCAEISNIPKKEAIQQTEELLKLVGLEDNNKRVSFYSRGMKQRLGIAQALLNQPKLLICDEPTSALDPVGRREVLAILQKVKKQTTILFSSHILEDVEKISDEIVLLHNGKTTAADELLAQKKSPSKQQWLLQTATSLSEVQYLELAKSFQIKEVSTKHYEITNNQNKTQKELLTIFITLDITILKIEVKQPTLEELFEEVIK